MRAHEWRQVFKRWFQQLDEDRRSETSEEGRRVFKRSGTGQRLTIQVVTSSSAWQGEAIEARDECLVLYCELKGNSQSEWWPVVCVDWPRIVAIQAMRDWPDAFERVAHQVGDVLTAASDTI